jgi:hypothetical protein
VSLGLFAAAPPAQWRLDSGSPRKSTNAEVSRSRWPRSVDGGRVTRRKRERLRHWSNVQIPAADWSEVPHQKSEDLADPSGNLKAGGLPIPELLTLLRHK